MGALRMRHLVTAAAAATALVAAAAVPASAATIHDGDLSTSQIVAHALRYAPTSTMSAPDTNAAKVATRIQAATATLTSHSGSASLTVGDPANSVIQAEPGWVRELTVLHQGNTARFALTLPAGATLHSTSSGGFLMLNRASRAVGFIAAPWAVDARGKRLSTHYTADGSVIVQSIDTRGAVYPIVADPSFRWYWDGVVITLSWADQMAVADGGLTILEPILLASGYGWPVVWAVGYVAARAGFYAAHHQCYWFWVPYLSPWDTSWGTYAC